MQVGINQAGPEGHRLVRCLLERGVVQAAQVTSLHPTIPRG